MLFTLSFALRLKRPRNTLLGFPFPFSLSKKKKKKNRSHAAPRRSQRASLSGARGSCSSRIPLDQQGCCRSGAPPSRQQARLSPPPPQRCICRFFFRICCCCSRRRRRRNRRGDRREDARDQGPVARLSVWHGAGSLRLERGKEVSRKGKSRKEKGDGPNNKKPRRRRVSIG